MPAASDGALADKLEGPFRRDLRGNVTDRKLDSDCRSRPVFDLLEQSDISDIRRRNFLAVL